MICIENVKGLTGDEKEETRRKEGNVKTVQNEQNEQGCNMGK